MKPNRILLYDPNTRGHHVSHAAYMIRYLCEQDYEVKFVTSIENNEIELMVKNQKNLTIEYIDTKLNEWAGGNLVSLYTQILIRQVRILNGLKQCFRIAKNWNADVVHLLCLDYNILPLYLLSFVWRKRSWRTYGIMIGSLTHQHNERMDFVKKLHNYLNVVSFRRMLKKGILSGITVVTTEKRDSLIEALGKHNVQIERIIAVPSPTDEFYSLCSTEEARKRLQLPEDVPILLFFGDMRWDKGADILLEAIQYIDHDFRLVIAGLPDYVTSDDIKTYQEKIAKPENIITRLEYIPEEETGYYFLSADAVVLPYRKGYKTISGILQNAASAGKPVIASDVGQIGEVVKKRSLGIVVEPDSIEALRDSIEGFLEDREMITNNVIPNAIEYSGENDWRQFASLIESTYDAINANEAIYENNNFSG